MVPTVGEREGEDREGAKERVTTAMSHSCHSFGKIWAFSLRFCPWVVVVVLVSVGLLFIAVDVVHVGL